MSTPTTNYVPTTLVSIGTANEDALIFGTKWGSGGYNTGVTLTYSFPAGTDTRWITSYGYYAGNGAVEGEWDSWYALLTTEQAGVVSALGKWSALANVIFQPVTDNTTTVGDLRFALTDIPNTSENAHAYPPANDPSAGDVWLQARSWHTTPSSPVVLGSYDYFTLLHEIGHAIGLKHPFEGSERLPSIYDSYSFTVMSYTASTSNIPLTDNYASYYPTTPMYYDIAAIQKLYGRAVHNPGNNTYKYDGTQHYWQTIDDSGGVDTIVYVSTKGGTIDLNVGHWSYLGVPITFNNAPPQAWTVAIGPGTVIENATGGSGPDTLIGNSSANVLNGGAGADLMKGGANNDTYVVDNIGDVVDESVAALGAGTDLIKSSVSIKLGDTVHVKGVVENLILLGTAPISGIGNGSANAIVGNAAANTLAGGSGADRLTGGAGPDTLIGGTGNDRFVFAAGFGKDVITDFAAGLAIGDVISIAKTVLANFAAVLTHSSLVGGHVVIKADASDQITLNTVTHVADLNANDFLFT